VLKKAESALMPDFLQLVPTLQDEDDFPPQLALFATDPDGFRHGNYEIVAATLCSVAQTLERDPLMNAAMDRIGFDRDPSVQELDDPALGTGQHLALVCEHSVRRQAIPLSIVTVEEEMDGGLASRVLSEAKEMIAGMRAQIDLQIAHEQRVSFMDDDIPSTIDDPRWENTREWTISLSQQGVIVLPDMNSEPGQIDTDEIVFYCRETLGYDLTGNRHSYMFSGNRGDTIEEVSRIALQYLEGSTKVLMYVDPNQPWSGVIIAFSDPQAKMDEGYDSGEIVEDLSDALDLDSRENIAICTSPPPDDRWEKVHHPKFSVRYYRHIHEGRLDDDKLEHLRTFLRNQQSNIHIHLHVERMEDANSELSGVRARITPYILRGF